MQSHAGKVVERHWYEKNKHIFPASRWEVSMQSLLAQLIPSSHAVLLLYILKKWIKWVVGAGRIWSSTWHCTWHWPKELMFIVFWQIYDPTKRWERYTIHGDWWRALESSQAFKAGQYLCFDVGRSIKSPECCSMVSESVLASCCWQCLFQVFNVSLYFFGHSSYIRNKVW